MVIHIRHQIAKCFCFISTENQWTISIWRIYISFDRFFVVRTFIYIQRVRIVSIQFSLYFFHPKWFVCARVPFLSILWAFHKECLWNSIFDSADIRVYSLHIAIQPYNLQTSLHSLYTTSVVLQDFVQRVQWQCKMKILEFVSTNGRAFLFLSLCFDSRLSFVADHYIYPIHFVKVSPLGFPFAPLLRAL